MADHLHVESQLHARKPPTPLTAAMMRDAECPGQAMAVSLASHKKCNLQGRVGVGGMIWV